VKIRIVKYTAILLNIYLSKVHCVLVSSGI